MDGGRDGPGRQVAWSPVSNSSPILSPGWGFRHISANNAKLCESWKWVWSSSISSASTSTGWVQIAVQNCSWGSWNLFAMPSANCTLVVLPWCWMCGPWTTRRTASGDSVPRRVAVWERVNRHIADAWHQWDKPGIGPGEWCDAGQGLASRQVPRVDDQGQTGDTPWNDTQETVRNPDVRGTVVHSALVPYG